MNKMIRLSLPHDQSVTLRADPELHNQGILYRKFVIHVTHCSKINPTYFMSSNSSHTNGFIGSKEYIYNLAMVLTALFL